MTNLFELASLHFFPLTFKSGFSCGMRKWMTVSVSKKFNTEVALSSKNQFYGSRGDLSTRDNPQGIMPTTVGMCLWMPEPRRRPQIPSVGTALQAAVPSRSAFVGGSRGNVFCSCVGQPPTPSPKCRCLLLLEKLKPALHSSLDLGQSQIQFNESYSYIHILQK